MQYFWSRSLNCFSISDSSTITMDFEWLNKETILLQNSLRNMFGNSGNFTRRNKTCLGQSEARVTILDFKSFPRDTTLPRDPSRNTLFVKFKM